MSSPPAPRRLRTLLCGAVCPRAVQTARLVARRARARFERACGAPRPGTSDRPHGRRAGAAPPGAIGRAIARRSSASLILLTLAALGGELQAQNVISVPFTNGFVGARGSSAGTSNGVLTFATLGIARTFFIQNSSTTQFQELQGNDISGTLRIVRTNGTTLDIPASANWRINSGSTTNLIGILPRPTSPITFTYSGGSIQITDGANPGGSSIGGYVAAYGGALAGDGDDVGGNAAQVLSSLNAYLATVVASRPAGPVTVTAQTTASATPTITGTATMAVGEQLSVVVDGVQYTSTSTPAVVRSGNSWSLTLTTPLAVGTYAIAATLTDVDGFTLSDATTNELVLTSPGGTVTIAGSFTANDRVYDGTTAATGSTGGLTLAGVHGGHQVTIASVTLAFQSAAVGAGKTVVVTAVTLGGPEAAQYGVSLAGAPTATAGITAKALTVTGVSAASRAYDGSTAASLTGTATYTGLASGDSFTPSGTPTASFASATIGAGKAVTVVGYTAPSANYTVTQPAGLTANVTARPLTIGGAFAVASRPYDGTTHAPIAANGLSLVGVVPGDTVALTGVSAAFASAVVGTGKTISLTAAGLTGPHAANYTMSLAGAPTTTADITSAGGAVTLGGSFTAADRVYDGTASATGATGALTLVGVTAPDQVTIASVTLGFQSSTVGSGKTVVLTGVTLAGANAAQYTVDLAGAPTTTASIAAKTLTITGSFTAADKTADGTTAATIGTNALALSGVVGGDAVGLTGTAATFADAAVGTSKPVSLANASLTGAAAANYVLSLAGAPTTTANITAAGGTVTIAGTLTASDRMYDGTTAASGSAGGLALAGVHGGHQVTIASVALAFQTASVGRGKTVVITAITLAGANAAQYTVTLAGAPTTTATISPKGLSIGGTLAAADKVFDGTTTATIGTGDLRLLGTLSGDLVALTGATGAFVSAEVGTGRTVVLTGAALSGPAAANYAVSLSGAPTATARIMAATPPSAPRDPVATGGDGTIAISWASPETAGCHAVGGYIVEYSADDGRSWMRVTLASPTATSTVIPGLVNNVAYRVRVAAANPCGAGTFSAILGPIVPSGPMRNDAGAPTTVAPGTATSVTGGIRQPVTTEVLQDTIVRAAGDGFTLRLRASDQPGAAIPIDGTRTLQLEQGGRAMADGTGFAPGTFVTMYLVTAGGSPSLLGRVPVTPDETFSAALPIPSGLAEGTYTLQVNGIGPNARARSVALGVEVVPPPPELDLVATPDQRSPAVGDTVVITLTVTNHGRGVATDVVIPRAFREPGLRLVRTTPIEGRYDAGTQEWTIGRIEPGAHARMLLTVVILAPAASQVPTP